jgi:hypothetical protein
MLFDDLVFVVIVTAHRGGGFSEGERMRFGSLQSAVDESESLQTDFDTDAEPRRVYVLDASRVPIWAGGARGRPPAASRPEKVQERGTGRQFSRVT